MVMSAIAGSVLFGGKINDCFLIIFGDQLYNKSNYFDKTFDYSAQTGPSVISSEPTNVCFSDDNNTMNRSQTQLTMTAYPGEEINISVVAVGQDSGVAPGIIELQPLYVDEASSHSYLYNTTAEHCTNITLKPVYHVNRKIFLKINVYNKLGLSILTLKIKLLCCPIGFQVSSTTKYCDCNEQFKNATANQIKCNAANNTITRPEGYDIWIGKISDSVILHTPCPLLLTTVKKHKPASFSLILIPSVLITGLEHCVEVVNRTSALLWDPTTVFNVINSHTLL